MSWILTVTYELQNVTHTVRACKTVSRITYTVLVETLNPAQSIGRLKLWCYFCCLLTKVHQIRCVHAEKIAVCNAVQFPIDDVLFCSADIRDQVAKLYEIGPKF